MSIIMKVSYTKSNNCLQYTYFVLTIYLLFVYHILTICLQYTYYLFTIYLLFVYNILTICLQYTYYLFTIYLLFVYNILTICLQYTYYLFTIYLLFVYNILTICLQYTYYLFTIYLLFALNVGFTTWFGPKIIKKMSVYWQLYTRTFAQCLVLCVLFYISVLVLLHIACFSSIYGWWIPC
jgi:hypothetical protein